MIDLFTPVTLSGQHVALEPLTSAHHDDLLTAVDDGQLWNLWYTRIPHPTGLADEIRRRLDLHKQGLMLPFAVRLLAENRVVGMTTIMNIDSAHRRVEIGSTWYAQSVQRTGLNTECKRLLLAHAFETLECIAVEFRTSSFNFASRQAIERLGAKLDGVLRNHIRMQNGTLRDTYVYSILPSEWPAVRQHLDFRLQRG